MSQSQNRLIFLRHLSTEWNLKRLYQGRNDVALHETSRTEARRLKCPDEFAPAELFSSPLERARETAELVFERAPTIDERLIEISYGIYEGQPLGSIAKDLPEGASPWLGLDHKPSGGESLREAMERLKPWLDERALSKKDTIAVTHKGVLNAIFAIATGWDALSKPRPRLREGLHVFRFTATGLILERANVPFEIRS